MRKRPFRHKLTALAAAGVLAGAVGGTVAAFSAGTSSSGNTFSAAASFSSCTGTSPSTGWLTGMEHGVASTAGGGLFDYLLAASVDSTTARTGSYSLRLNAVAGSNAYAGKLVSGSSLVMRFALRFPSLPSADVTMLAGTYVSTGSNLQLGYKAAEQKLSLAWAGTGTVLADAPVEAGRWYVIDLHANVGASPRTGHWRIDGVAQPTASSAEAATSNVIAALGSFVSTDNYTVHYDDIAASASASRYPIGDGRIHLLRPDGIASHSGPENFRHEDGTAIDANSWSRLSDVPMSSTAGNLQQRTPSSGSYLGFTFENPTHSCIRAVSAIVAYRSAANPANNAKTSIIDGSAERTIFAGDMSDTVLTYKSQTIPSSEPLWSRNAVDGLIGRIGYASDVKSVPYWDALLLEYETPGS